MTRVADRYDLQHVVGRGGMGEVWAARDVRGGRDVAIKTAAAHAAKDLRHEAAVTASIDHPRVVGVHDSGDDGATAYLVMDLLPGTDLAELLRDGALPAAQAVDVTAAVADALAAAHRAGVVHGDVTPANVVVADGDAVLIDFGVAATADDDDRVRYGTVSYMAPEQVTSRPLTPATDVYALGCLLTAAITGRPPFAADSPTAVLHQHVRAPAPRLRELASGVPPRLDDLLATMLDKAPRLRPSAARVRDTLCELARDVTLARTRPTPVPVPAARLDPEATLPALVALAGEASPRAA